MESNKNKGNKGFKIFVLLFLVVILFFVNKDNQDKFTNAYRSLTIREKNLERLTSIKLDTGDQIGLLDKDIFKWSHDTLSIIDIDENLLLEKQFNFESADIIFGRNLLYIMDKNIGDIYIVDNQGETLERVILDSEISNLREFGDNILVNTKSEDLESLILVTNEGRILRSHPIVDMNILTYDIKKNGEGYLLTSLEIGDGLSSQAFSYSIDGELLANILIENEIIVFSSFVNDDIIVLSDSSLYYIKDDKILWEKDIANIKDIEVKDEEIYILYGNNLEIIDLEGETKGNFSLNSDYNSLTYFEEYIILRGRSSILGIQGNKEILNYYHDKLIDDIIINENYIAIIDDTNLHLFELTNK